jgi:hypothetical protein
VIRPPAPLPLPLPRLAPAQTDFLRALYRELAAELQAAGAACDACGRCCHLVERGHELWLTDTELALLLREAGSPGLCDGNSCPYLEGDRCRARSGRALGCRVYHCQLPRPTVERLAETYHRRLVEGLRRIGHEPAYGELLASLARLSGA